MTAAPNTDTRLATANYNQFKALARREDTMARFAEILGSNAPAYVSSIILAVSDSTKLQECSAQSIMTSAMRAATLRLSCDPSLKQAHLVPFKGKATLVVGYKGYYDMAQRTGRYRVLNDFKVYEGQEVVEDQLTGAIEIKGFRASRDAQVIGYGFYFEMLPKYGGLKHVLYMTNEEIEAHGAHYSKTYNYPSSMWKTDFPAMARKTVIRLCLSRYGYLDPNDRMALEAIDEDHTVAVSYPDDEPEPPQRQRPEAIMKDLGFDDEQPVEGEVREEAQPEPEAESEPAPADPYAGLRTQAETDPATAFWLLQKKINFDRKDAQAIINENKGDMVKSFAALLRQAPPAML